MSMGNSIRHHVARAKDRRRVTFRGCDDDGQPRFSTSAKGGDTYPQDMAYSIARWYFRSTGKMCDLEVAQ